MSEDFILAAIPSPLFSLKGRFQDIRLSVKLALFMAFLTSIPKMSTSLKGSMQQGIEKQNTFGGISRLTSCPNMPFTIRLIV